MVDMFAEDICGVDAADLADLAAPSIFWVVEQLS
tara:strand:- start:491 stop:592 length:102 start_codon:yes stop_codon:yes gene_type:complete